jgi:hypothetical protein
VLVEGLPANAAVWREDPAVFERQDELLAVLIEEIGRWGRINLSAMGAKEADLPDVRNVRPVEVREKRPKSKTTITDLSDPRLLQFFGRAG